MEPRVHYRRRARLLRFAKAVQWLGILWNFLCWGYALLELARNARFSDAVGNAVPAALIGGLGFTIAWVAAWLIKGSAKKKAKA